MTARAATDLRVPETGPYRCESCNEEGIGVAVHLLGGDYAPSCLRHRTVNWLLVP
ncbi:MAG: hypothetical protein ACE5LS_04245 [Thermoplasmata archaeon]